MPRTAGLLSGRCRQEFGGGDRQRGTDYFQRGNVTLKRLGANSAAARVEGSWRSGYEVRVDWSDAAESGTLYVSCTCPRFEDGFNCKHLWATLLQLDVKGSGDRVPGEGKLSLDVWEAADEEYDDFEDDDEYDPFDFDEEPWYDEAGEGEYAARSAASSAQFFRGRRPGGRSSWKAQLAQVRPGGLFARRERTRLLEDVRERQVLFVIDPGMSDGGPGLHVRFVQRGRKRDGEWGATKEFRAGAEAIDALTDTVGRELVRRLLQAQVTYHDEYAYPPEPVSVTLPPVAFEHVLPELAGSGRLFWANNPRFAELDDVLAWDDGAAWRFELGFEPSEEDYWRLAGRLRRGREVCDVGEPVALVPEGLVIWRNTLARLEPIEHERWLETVRYGPEVHIPHSDRDELVRFLWSQPGLPPIDLPKELEVETEHCEPRPRMEIDRAGGYGPRKFRATVSFDYGGQIVQADDEAAGVYVRDEGKVLLRNREREAEALAGLLPLGFRDGSHRVAREPGELELVERHFAEALRQLIDAGWDVRAEGQQLRSAGVVSMRVSTGVDWFEVEGEIEFGGLSIGLPELLDAVRRKDGYVTLGDGSRGMLPEAWLERYAPLANLSHNESDGAVRFKPSQAALLDALLEAEPRVDADRAFARVRNRLRSFERVKPRNEPRGFRGELRDYQSEGLGWLGFLQEFGFGGCLADDMGLGKTVQVLALLQAQRASGRPREEKRPSLVVAPKSVVYNWLDEAERFAPRLEALDYTGRERKEFLEELDAYDLVVTTYGTLRRDAVELKEQEFDYVVLDEAQAIKNAQSQAAKACRLLSARHRLALTGTPVENHLGELWSIFEFLNPGMLGRLPGIKSLASKREANPEALGLLAKALRPFILRRTKEQVLKELPEKTEQTLVCDLDRKQRKLYDELRDHYRAHLSKKLESVGLKRSKIHVLEALLRLRQAACHPGLLDEKRAAEPSAKLDVLLEQLEEVASEGHKALVFSQFTSLLAIVRERLDKKGITYEYLDGRTRKRKKRVERFQEDPDCRAFLISLKAGGQGLNLTASDYVFILDPWWNPAVEAQAVDRAHRIGQTRPVFAYRLIARDTVEEKILELQRSKRELADAIISADNSVIGNLTAEDLQLLLS